MYRVERISILLDCFSVGKVSHNSEPLSSLYFFYSSSLILFSLYFYYVIACPLLLLLGSLTLLCEVDPDIIFQLSLMQALSGIISDDL